MNGIRHIEFWVSDLQSAISFYSGLFGVLGWQKVDENCFSCGDSKIYLIERSGLVSGIEVPGPRHICFQAKDGETVDALADMPFIKGKILHGPGIIHGNGSYMLVFKDPDGYVLEAAYKG
jgi:catechol 2,3-dioxygenase-like lactoylglutathione lyase family enzyme